MGTMIYSHQEAKPIKFDKKQRKTITSMPEVEEEAIPSNKSGDGNNNMFASGGSKKDKSDKDPVTVKIS